MKKILWVLAHPHLEKSRANRLILNQIKSCPNLKTHLLYDEYPRFHISVAREQQLLLEHDFIFIQHPFYWYSMPPLLKLWLDEVLESGWAYGPGGTMLKGKDFCLSITAGGPEDSYSQSGYNRFSMDELLAPWNQTAHLCGMNYLKPFVLHRSMRATDDEIQLHAERIRASLVQYLEKGN